MKEIEFFFEEIRDSKSFIYELQYTFYETNSSATFPGIKGHAIIKHAFQIYDCILIGIH